MRKLTYILTAAVAVSFAGAAHAQTLSFTERPSDARAAAMGTAAVGLPASPFAAHTNASAVAFTTARSAVGVSYTLWQPDRMTGHTYNAGGFHRLNDRIGLSAGFRFNEMARITLFDGDGNDMGGFTPKEFAIDLGIAYRVHEKIAVGAAVRYLHSDLGGSSAGRAVAADVNATFRPIANLALGVGVSNLGTKVDYGGEKYELPATVRAGGSYTLGLADRHAVTGSLEAGYRLMPSDLTGFAGGIGAEYSYNDLVSVRGGYRVGDDSKTGPSYATAGVGIRLWGAALDAAYVFGGKGSAMKNTMFLSLAVKW